MADVDGNRPRRPKKNPKEVKLNFPPNGFKLATSRPVEPFSGMPSTPNEWREGVWVTFKARWSLFEGCDQDDFVLKEKKKL